MAQAHARVSIADALSAIDAKVREQVDAHPIRTVAVAAAAGFAIGGGMSSPTVRRVALGVTRFAVKTMWRDLAAIAVAATLSAHNARTP